MATMIFTFEPTTGAKFTNPFIEVPGFVDNGLLINSFGFAAAMPDNTTKGRVEFGDVSVTFPTLDAYSILLTNLGEGTDIAQVSVVAGNVLSDKFDKMVEFIFKDVTFKTCSKQTSAQMPGSGAYQLTFSWRTMNSTYWQQGANKTMEQVNTFGFSKTTGKVL